MHRRSAKGSGHEHHDEMSQHGEDVVEGPVNEAKPQPIPNERVRLTVMEKVKNKCTQWLERAEEMIPLKFRNFIRPVHFLMILAVAMVATAVFDLAGHMNNVSAASRHVVVKPQPVVNFIYLTSLGLHVGSQYWMTVVSGLSLYFNLSKHAFGDVQKILFPRYFLSNSVLSALVLIQFVKMHGNSYEGNFYTSLQLFVLSLRFLVEVFIRLYLVPPLLGLMSVKMTIESSAGIGKRVGRYDIGPLVDCPHYMAVNKTFRLIHTCMAAGNVVTIICTLVHLVYVAATVVYGTGGTAGAAAVSV